MVNDPILLRRILEALLLDDLKQKQQLNLKELLEEMGYPTDIEYDVEERIENYEITPRQLCIWLVQKNLKSINSRFGYFRPHTLGQNDYVTGL